MPLPPKLLARLEKRGLVKNKEDDNLPEKKDENKENLKDDEEVIAENYDDIEKKPIEKSQTDDTIKQYIGADDCPIDIEELKAHIEAKFKGYPGCPNKYNVWHECTLFCKEYWGDGHKKPNKRYTHLRKKMLERYPLPFNWTEVYDPGTGRFYYWDEDTDAVSWLPPTHPRAVITDSAAHFREERYMVEKNIYSDEDENSSDSDSSISSLEDDKRKKKRYSSSSDENSDSDSKDERRRQKCYQDTRKIKYKEERRVKVNELDPMDPSSYSDVPRGGWNEGLNISSEAKTGADTTAAGPLYQMRPYPNPGAVLRANAKLKSNEEAE